MRLIDADTLIDFIDCGHLRNPGESCFSECDVVGMLEARPTIDAVEVVRCKECIHVRDNDCPLTGWARSDEDFCSYGEREEGATMTNEEALECFESDCNTCQFEGRDCLSCRTLS